jgi:branched-chain amino acid transport system substrate-binding protein
VSADFYTPGEKDFYSYFTKVKGSGADGINIVDVSAVTANMMKQMVELGLKAKLLASDGPVTDTFIKIGGPIVEGVPMVIRYSDQMESARNKKLVDAYRAVRGGDVPDQYAQAGYDGVHMIAAAIKRAGSADPAKIRDALRKTDYTSISGSPLRFDERQQATPKIFVAVVKGGKRVIQQEIDTAGVPY